MKKIFLFSLLGFIGCSKNTFPVREHQIVCFDRDHKDLTHNITTSRNVSVFIVKDKLGIEHPVLAYWNDDLDKIQVFYLELNDCEVY